MNVQFVSGTYFPTSASVLSSAAPSTDDDDRTEGKNPVTAVISYAWWNGSLARDPKVLSRTLRLGDTTFDIVGVAPQEFFGTTVGQSPDIWVPMSMIAVVPPKLGGYSDKFTEPLYILGRSQAPASLLRRQPPTSIFSSTRYGSAITTSMSPRRKTSTISQKQCHVFSIHLCFILWICGVGVPSAVSKRCWLSPLSVSFAGSPVLTFIIIIAQAVSPPAICEFSVSMGRHRLPHLLDFIGFPADRKSAHRISWLSITASAFFSLFSGMFFCFFLVDVQREFPANPRCLHPPSGAYYFTSIIDLALLTISL